jgi:thiamine-phosphate pyrophosphorylase
VVAIGGITAGNAATLVAAGAQLLAVVHDLWSGEDCAARARALCRCF